MRLDAAAAEPLIADAVAKHTQLAGASPGDVFILRDLSIAQNIHASALMRLNRNSEAVEVARASLETGCAAEIRTSRARAWGAYIVLPRKSKTGASARR